MDIILIISIFFQLAAVVISIKLIKITKIYLPWLLVALAILLMTVRRVIALIAVLNESIIISGSLTAEYVALTISMFISIGLFFMIPFFKSISKNKSELESKNRLLLNSKEEIKKSEKKFKKLSNLTFEGILIHDKGVVVDMNLSLEKIVGYSCEELVGKNVIDLLVPKKHQKVISKSIVENYSHPFELEIKRKDGSIFPIEIEAREFLTEDDKKLRVAAIRDVTKRKETESHTRQLDIAINNSINEVYVFNATDLKFTYVNKRVIEKLGYPLEKLKTMTPVDIKPEFSHDRFVKTILPLKKGEIDSLQFETFHQRSDKTTYPIEINLSTFTIQNSLHYLAMIIDVSESKQLERERLKNIEITNRYIQESQSIASLGYYIYDFNTNKMDVSESFSETMGLRSLDKSLEAWINTIHPEDRHLLIDIFNKRQKDPGILLDATYRIISPKNGNIRWMHHVSKAIEKDDKGNVLPSLGILQDITDRKKVEKALFENNLQFSQLADNTSDVFGVGDMSDLKNIKWLYLNPAFERVWQLTAESLYQDSSVWFNPIHEEDRERSRTAFMNFLYGENQEYNIKFRIVRTDKTIRYIHATANLIKDHNGKVIRFAWISRDITEQKKYEEKLVEKTTELQESLAILEGKNHELEQFAYISSHDLQEPLSTITSFAELLDQQYRGKLDDDADTYLQFILDSTSRMRNLIHGLLEYSILGKGKTAERVDCNEILSFVLEDLQGVISEKQGKIESGPLPTLNAHPIEIKQLFENLISNALKYCREGVTPVINISSRKKDSTWEFKFKDNGIGIDEKYYEKIFVIFQRLHNNQDYEGTGIGLAHCRKIAELHNGRIWVESIPNEGSEFYFTIKM